MHCPRRDADIPDGTKVCIDCGTPLTTRCPPCRADTLPQAKFCGACDTPLIAQSPASPAVYPWVFGRGNPYLQGRPLPARDRAAEGLFQIEGGDDARRIRAKVPAHLQTLDEALAPTLLALLDVPVDDSQWQALDPPQRRQAILNAVKRLLLREGVERLARAPRARGVQSSQGWLHELPGSVGYREPYGQGDVHHRWAMAESELSLISERVKLEMVTARARVEGLSSLKLLDEAQSSGGDHG